MWRISNSYENFVIVINFFSFMKRSGFHSTYRRITNAKIARRRSWCISFLFTFLCFRLRASFSLSAQRLSSASILPLCACIQTLWLFQLRHGEGVIKKWQNVKRYGRMHTSVALNNQNSWLPFYLLVLSRGSFLVVHYLSNTIECLKIKRLNRDSMQARPKSYRKNLKKFWKKGENW